MENKINRWKTVAIIFIVLFILETILFLWILNLGTNMIEEENECAINICADYDAYFYDDAGTCYCYIDNKMVYEEYLR